MFFSAISRRTKKSFKIDNFTFIFYKNALCAVEYIRSKIKFRMFTNRNEFIIQSEYCFLKTIWI